MNTTITSSQAVRDIVGREKISELMQRDDRPGMYFSLYHFGCLLLSGFSLYLSLGTYWFVPVFFLHGFFIVRLFAPYHEACHGSVFKTKWMNDTLHWLTGLILILPPLAFQYEHADHHTYTQDPEHDAQYVNADTLWGYLWYGSAIPYFINIARNLLLQPFGWVNQITKRAVPESERKKVQQEAWCFCLIYIVLIGASLWFESWAIVIFWLAPRILLEPLERLIRMTEHVGCAKCPDMLTNTRTVRINPLLSRLSWNMPYHNAHHAIPLVPFHALPELDAHLRGHIKHNESGFSRTIYKQVKTLLRQQ